MIKQFIGTIGLSLWEAKLVEKLVKILKASGWHEHERLAYYIKNFDKIDC